MRRIGVGYRHELHDWLIKKPSSVESLEITAEHFFDADNRAAHTLKQLSKSYPLFVHGLGLSLGTPGPLCAETLEQFANVAKLADAEWVSEHVSFTRPQSVDLGHLNPILYSRDSLGVIVDHAIEVSEKCQRKLVLENITSSVRFESAMKETDFLNQLCEKANCGLLLDVTNLFINAKNHNFDPVDWLGELNPQNIWQLHVVGYSKCGSIYQDHHSAPIQNDLLDLIQFVFESTAVRAVTLERDERLEQIEEIELDLERLHNIDV